MPHTHIFVNLLHLETCCCNSNWATHETGNQYRSITK